MRMLKMPYGAECKVCNRAFTQFKWSPGEGRRYKQTHLCQTCAKIKNGCQSCGNDLEYGMHAQERDQVIPVHDSIPMTEFNSHTFVQKKEQEYGNRGVVHHGKAEQVAKQVIRKMAREQAEPYAQRSKQITCSFYVKGNCKRDKSCPFAHVMPEPKKKIKKTQQETVVYQDEEKPVSLLPPPPLEEDDVVYPSQDPQMLGTTERTFQSD
ncbi:hypothetical protein EDD86DRAFT_202720 [Gorgonomyces haynaldii]|nr:hypothetical protein EDD86DRAFT_202720 [Gorgonomyces haynaldii]